ncbi:hypothetical protein AURDEDRAFT_164816 [Auricularia subglabra TFB-10046 SS5]|nr:hypothetical protein AURDEDRAFT_164816 [Auricularia subglabra TFB-10046 SS5]
MTGFDLPLPDIPNLLYRLVHPSKQLKLHVHDYRGRMPPPLPPGHVFPNLVALEVTGKFYPNLLLNILLRMPSLKHLTLGLSESSYGPVPSDPPPFTLQTFTCRGCVWFGDRAWTWPISNLGTQRLQHFSFKCDGSRTFTNSIQENPFAGLLTAARMYLHGGVDQPISPNDAAALQLCTSLRSLELMVNWASGEVMSRLGAVFVLLPATIQSLTLYPTTSLVPTDVAAVDEFLAMQLCVAPKLSALRKITISVIPSNPPPFTLQTCGGYACSEHKWLTSWLPSNPGDRRGGAFEYPKPQAFSTCFKDNAFAHLLTSTRLWPFDAPGKTKHPDDAGTLRQCTSLRVKPFDVRDSTLARQAIHYKHTRTTLLGQ